MKYRILFLIVVFLFMVGCGNDNYLSEYKATSLQVALLEEGIITNYNFDNYDESKAKVTIYLFRGNGCSHCYDFLNFTANTLLKEYNNKIRVVSYEVWNYPKNKELMAKVKEYMGDASKTGVPYIVIGDETFYGFGDSMADDIRSAIDKALDSFTQYDVLEKIA